MPIFVIDLVILIVILLFKPSMGESEEDHFGLSSGKRRESPIDKLNCSDLPPQIG